MPYCKDYFLSWVPDCIKCCKQNRREKAFEKARDKLEKEMNIIELIKKQRYFARAIKHLLSQNFRLELKE